VCGESVLVFVGESTFTIGGFSQGVFLGVKRGKASGIEG